MLQKLEAMENEKQIVAEKYRVLDEKFRRKRLASKMGVSFAKGYYLHHFLEKTQQSI